jgi:LPS sulfotransferase NodH
MAGFEYFVVLAGMRTGSNLLEANLNEFAALRCHGELFNPNSIGDPRRTEMPGVTLAQRERAPLDLIGRLKGQKELCGFRMFHDHDERVLAHVLADPACAKIVLSRNALESYVSLKIAQATDMWRISEMREVQKGRVTFDEAEFTRFLEGVTAFRQRILRSLQVSGQGAFFLAYEDAADPEVLEGIARFLGVDPARKPAAVKPRKQNPEPLEEKVANYAEMVAALANVDLFGLTRDPVFEPRRGPAIPSYSATASAPLLFMPVPSGPEAGIISWMRGADPSGTVHERQFNQKALRQWMRKHPGHRSFVVLRHPVARAYACFRDQILTQESEAMTSLRAFLGKVYGLVLPQAGRSAEMTDDQRRAAFLGFLKFVAGNLAGQTSAWTEPGWASQLAILQGIAQFALPDLVLREEELPVALAGLARDLKLAAPEFTPDPPDPDLARIYGAEVEAAARAAYPRDYLVFGFSDWRA